MENYFKLLICLSLISCSSLKRHDQQGPNSGTQQTQPASQDSDQNGEQLIEPQVKEKKKIGLILGPGYLASYAHLGVLKQLEENRLDLDAIAGIGWGAVFAGGYSIRQKTTNIEWQLFKLEKENIHRTALFGSKLKKALVQNLSPVLDKLFERNRINQAEVPFLCSSLNLRSFRQRVIDTGSFKQAVSYCLAGNGFYEPSDLWVWQPFGLDQIVKEFRSKGIDKIVYVNVLNRESLNRSFSEETYLSDKQIWVQAYNSLEAQRSKVDYWLDIDLGAADLKDIKNIREYSRQGRIQSRETVLQINSEVLGR